MFERDAETIDALVRAHHADVWRLCRALVGGDAADDVTQDTFIRAARALPGFRGESSARTWLLAIARRACVDELRRSGRRARRDRALAEPARAAAPVRSGADGVELRDLISRLEPDRRTAFVLTQVIGLSYDEAAAVCDCPVGTIRSRVARAREELIGELSEHPLSRDAADRR